jgi:hypothetical protein
MTKVKGVKVKLSQIINSEAPNAAHKEWVTPKKVTILAYNSGTLVEAEEGGLFLVPVGDWFRSGNIGKAAPQVDAFNELQDYGLTAIKDKMVRHEQKVEAPKKEEVKPVVTKIPERLNGQEIRSQNNVVPKKINKAMAPDIKSQKKY